MIANHAHPGNPLTDLLAPVTVRATAFPEITLDRTTPISLHYQIVQQLRALIVDGRIEPGTALLPEPDLAEHTGVSRSTIRQAIEPLVREGLLRRERGRGTFVQQPSGRCPTCGAERPVL